MRISAAFAVVAIAGVIASAQAPAPPGSPSAQPTFRGGVTLVTTDVIPRDGSGRFISDLTKDDFVVSEDGEPQQVTSFTMVQGGRVFNLLEPAPVAAPEGIVLPPQRRAADMGSGRILLVFVDDLHFEAQYTPHVRRIVQQMADTLMHDSDMVGMVSSGPSSIEINPTLDRRMVSSAVKNRPGYRKAHSCRAKPRRLQALRRVRK